MTPTQTWVAITELITNLYPDCIVKRVYAPSDELENIAFNEQPNIWVTLNSIQIGPVNTMATYIEDSYEFRITLIWKVKDANMIELDRRLDMTQAMITQFRNCSVDVGDSSLFFKIPTIETVYDNDLLISTGCYVSTLILPVIVYRTVKHN